MSFVDVDSLADGLRRRGPYGTEAALAVAEPVLQALRHGHAQGLVHRDIKPDNVMLETKTGRALLVDFGIAKLLRIDSGPSEGSAKTATGFTVGTVQYMSPEQALGQPNIDGRSDLYAFGAMLYQLVTGTPPYDGASSAEIVGKHLADPVPVASDVNAKIPRWLSSVIVKCLAKKPEDRYQSADEVLAALAAGRASGATGLVGARDRKSTRLNSSHGYTSYAVFCLKKKTHSSFGGSTLYSDASQVHTSSYANASHTVLYQTSARATSSTVVYSFLLGKKYTSSFSTS